MSSRDGSGPTGNKRRPAGAESSFGSPSSQGTYDIDPAEIDRYLSGQPQRPTRRSSTSPSSTSDQLDRLRRIVEPDDAIASVAPARQSTSSPAASRTSTSSRARRPARATYDEVYREDAYRYEGDGVDEYLDEYPGQWDEEGDPAIAGRSGRRAVQRPSLPSIPRVTIPRAITGAAILSDRTALAFIGVSVVSQIGMAVLVSNRITTLPAQIGTHVSASGVLEDFASREAIWRIPLLALMLTLMNVVIGVFAARFDRFASRLVLAAALVIHFLAWIALLRIL